jgi:hypothetical protein
MSDNRDNILVEIKSTFDKSGAVEAERSQDKLVEHTKPVAEQFKKTEKEVQASRQALAGLNSVAAAGQGSWMGLTRALEAFGGGLADVAAKASMVIGALSAGYALGSAIDKWFGISKAISEAIVPAEKYASIQDRIKAKLGDLNAASLAAVTKQFDTLTASVHATLAGMDKINSVKNELTGKETEALLAEIEAGMPPGIARDKALLAKKQERELASIEARKYQALEQLEIATKAKKVGEASVLDTETAEKEARFASMVAENKYKEDSGILNPFTNEYEVNPKRRAENLENASAARQRLQIAENVSRTARARQQQLEETYGQKETETWDTMRGLDLEERAVRARGIVGGNEIAAREQEDIDRKREEAAREDKRLQKEVEDLVKQEDQEQSRLARQELERKRAELAERIKELQTRALPAARVQDLRSRAQSVPGPTEARPAFTTARAMRARWATKTERRQEQTPLEQTDHNDDLPLPALRSRAQSVPGPTEARPAFTIDRNAQTRAARPAFTTDQDAQARAAAANKQTDSAVAMVLQLLEANAAKMKLLEDKIRNLPR